MNGGLGLLSSLFHPNLPGLRFWNLGDGVAIWQFYEELSWVANDYTTHTGSYKTIQNNTETNRNVKDQTGQ